MKLDLENDNVFVQELTIDEVRKSATDAEALSELNDKLYEWLDEAQGPVFVGEQTKTYLVIELTKGG